MTAPVDNPVLALARDLISRPSVTPEDAGCQILLGERLAGLGFRCRTMQIEDVTNLWAILGDDGPLLMFAGHTDVVPTGPEAQWVSPPFEPSVRDGYLYGRGAADMKSSLAAMVVAVERFLRRCPRPAGRIAFLVTSDEEGPAVHGTRAVIARLLAEDVHADYCLVGEPSSARALGDTIRVGRRGSLNGRLRILGVQGHVAYPDQARNPIHLFAPALSELATTRWDEGNAHFPPTSWQVSNLHAGTGANNVVPGELDVTCNFRFSTEQTPDGLQARVAEILERHGLDYEADWSLSGEPFLTPGGALVEATRDAIREVTGVESELSTSGGTSDGRFIAPTGCEVVELGPCNGTIHQLNERVALAELEPLAAIYGVVLDHLLGRT